MCRTDKNATVADVDRETSVQPMTSDYCAVTSTQTLRLRLEDDALPKTETNLN